MWYRNVQGLIYKKLSSVCKSYKIVPVFKNPRFNEIKYVVKVVVRNDSQFPFVRKRVIAIQKDLRESLENLESDYRISFMSCIFTNSEFSFKLSVDRKNTDMAKNQETILSNKVGFTQNVFGMVFSDKNLEYEIIDIRLKNYKYPVLVRRKSDNAMMKFPVAHIKEKIGGDRIINRNANLDKLLDNF